MWAVNLPAIIISKFFRKKVILNFVGGSAIHNSGNWNIIKKSPFYLADVVVVPTKNFAEGLVKIGLIYDYTIIPHVVKLDRFLDVKRVGNEKIILALKSLEKYSEYETLIEIYEIINQQIPDLELWIIGDGPEKNKLLKIIQKKKLNNIKLLGNVKNENIPDIMSKVSVFAHTSKYESFGIAIVEAIAAGWLLLPLM